MATSTAPELVSIRIVARPDYDPDTSWIGELTDSELPHAIHWEFGEFVADMIRDLLTESLADAKQLIRDRWADEVADGATIEFDADEDAIENRRLCATIYRSDDEHEYDYEELEYDIPRDRRAFTFFVAYAGGEHPDLSADSEYRRCAIQDYDRMRGLDRRDWNFVGIVAEGEVTIQGTTQTFRSGGLWGVESDSGDYLTDVAREELDGLRAILLDIGIDAETIAAATPEDLTPDFV